MSARHRDPLRLAFIEHVGRLLDPDGPALPGPNPYADLGVDAPASVRVQRLGDGATWMIDITTKAGLVREFHVTVRAVQGRSTGREPR